MKNEQVKLQLKKKKTFKSYTQYIYKVPLYNYRLQGDYF